MRKSEMIARLIYGNWIGAAFDPGQEEPFQCFLEALNLYAKERIEEERPKEPRYGELFAAMAAARRDTANAEEDPSAPLRSAQDDKCEGRSAQDDKEMGCSAQDDKEVGRSAQDERDGEGFAQDDNAGGARAPEDGTPDDGAEAPDTHTHTHTPAGHDRARGPAGGGRAFHTEGEGKQPEAFAGRSSGEKRAIAEKLTAYRKKAGLGCFRRLAAVTNGVLDEETIRSMFAGEKHTIQQWRLVGAALEQIGKEVKEP